MRICFIKKLELNTKSKANKTCLFGYVYIALDKPFIHSQKLRGKIEDRYYTNSYKQFYLEVTV